MMRALLAAALLALHGAHASHKFTKNAVDAETTRYVRVAVEVATASVVKMPDAVAKLFGQAEGAEVPAKQAQGAVAQHQDKFQAGEHAPGEVNIYYLEVEGPPAEFVLVDTKSGAEHRIPIEAGLHITYDNAVYEHRVDAHPDSKRTLLGPASLPPGGRRLEAVGAPAPIPAPAYSYSYTDAPTAAPTSETASPTASMAPTRTETYAPTRMTEAPSYAPTTDTYAPTFSSCPNLKDPDNCPQDATGLPLCSQQGLSTGDLCITGANICPVQNSTNCPAFQVARRLQDLPVHGPVTKAFHGWAQRHFKNSAGDDARRRLATAAKPDECVGDDCFVAQVGETAAPTAAPTTDTNCACAQGAADIRLVGGGTEFEGRVEVLCDGEWGTVCDDDWDIADANVVCQQLFGVDALEAKGMAFFGVGSGPIHLDDLDCVGDEATLSECSATDYFYSYLDACHDCDHWEDAGVVCNVP